MDVMVTEIMVSEDATFDWQIALNLDALIRECIPSASAALKHSMVRCNTKMPL